MNKDYYIVTGANGSIGQAITELSLPKTSQSSWLPEHSQITTHQTTNHRENR